jgi:hypothetical protein
MRIGSCGGVALGVDHHADASTQRTTTRRRKFEGVWIWSVGAQEYKTAEEEKKKKRRERERGREGRRSKERKREGWERAWPGIVGVQFTAQDGGI